jgi:PAS domain S-box-containing protein
VKPSVKPMLVVALGLAVVGFMAAALFQSRTSGRLADVGSTFSEEEVPRESAPTPSPLYQHEVSARRLAIFETRYLENQASDLFRRLRNVAARANRETASLVLALAALLAALVLVLYFDSGASARIKTREALRQTEQRSRLLVESLPDFAIFMLDPQGRVSSWSTSATRIKGYRGPEIIGKHFSCFYPQGDLKADRPRRQLEIASRWGSFEDEGWRLRKDGSSFWAKVVITSVKDGAGRLLGFVEVARDFTAVMQAQESLQKTRDLLGKELREHRQIESKFRALLDAATADALVVADHEGRIALANEQVEKLFGYQRQELVGHEIEMLMPERFRHVCREYRTSLVDGPLGRTTGSRAELYGLRKDGREFPAEISLKALETDQGMWITGSIRDITEQKNREAALRGLSGQLLRVQEEERRRVARELHDSAGQYLSVLLMGLNSLKSKMSGDPQGATLTLAECLRLAEESTKEVRTASYLLYPPLLEELGLKSAIPSYVEGFAKRSGIRAACEVVPNLRRLPSEAEVAIFRVLQESLTNVHRHSGSRTTHVGVTMDDRMVVLTVKDEGRGIPAELLDQFQNELAGTMGVGLRGMKERMRQLGGKLEVASTPKGTVVTASVPYPSSHSAISYGDSVVNSGGLENAIT